MRHWLALTGVLALTGCEMIGKDETFGEEAERLDTDRVVTAPTAADWQIGPIVGGKNVSVGMPLRPRQGPDSFYFDVLPGAQVDYVTFKHPPLNAYSKITATFAVEPLAEGARLVWADCPTQGVPGVYLFFQRKYDRWDIPDYRWWSVARHRIVAPVEFTIEAPLVFEGWKPLNVLKDTDMRPLFDLAKGHSSRVGFTFANCDSKGHGATALGGAVRFHIKKFVIEGAAP